MKTKFILFISAFLLIESTEATAQKFLNKVGKVLNKTENVTKTVSTTAEQLEKVDGETTTKIAWDKIPQFKAYPEKVIKDGKVMLNEDGTEQIRVFLKDQFGNKRSAASVKSQIAAVNKAVTKVIGKVGLGTAVGAGTALLSGGNKKDAIKGGIVGGVTGAVFSAEDIAYAKALKSSLKDQKKLVEAYAKNYTDEGIPTDAKVDYKKIEGLGLEKTEALSVKHEELLAQLQSEDFNSTDTSAWDF